MAQFAWQKRMDRARFLRSQHPAVSEILRVYEQISFFQVILFEQLAATPDGKVHGDWISATPVHRPALTKHFGEFLTVLGELNTEALAKAASELGGRSISDQLGLLEECWLPALCRRGRAAPSCYWREPFFSLTPNG